MIIHNDDNTYSLISGDKWKNKMSKPVAWQREDGVIAFHKQSQVDSQGFKWRPLYTHPIKQLSDEEIEAIMYKCDWSYDPVSFARAIIKEITE